MKNFFTKNQMWLWPILCMLAITPLTPTLDVAIEHYFFEENSHFSTNAFFSFIYDYGIIPANLVAGSALIFFIFSLLSKRYEKFRNIALIFILSLGIGAGVITHLIFKDHWGRPRPKQVIEFGGMQLFRPYYEPNLLHQPEPSKSFPCGHCTMGFYFFSVALIGRKLNNRRLFFFGIFLSLFLGGLLSLARMAQGGHFLSDILISALIMWLTAYFCVEIVLQTADKENSISVRKNEE